MARLGAAEKHLLEKPARPPSKNGGPLRRRAQAWNNRLVVLVLVLSDVFLAFLVWSGASVLHGIWGSGPLSEVATVTILPNVAAWIGLRASFGLYPGYGLDQVEELRRQTNAVVATLAITTTFAVALKAGDSFSRLLLVASFLGLALLAPLIRQLTKRMMKRIGLWGKPIVVLRAGEEAAQLIKALQGEWGLGLRPIAVFDDRRDLEGEPFEGVPYGGSILDSTRWAREHGVDTAILAAPRVRDDQLSDLIDWAGASFPYVIVIPNLGGIKHSAVTARDLAGTFGVEIKHNLLNPWTRRGKRGLDLLGATIGGLLISPLLLATVLLIKLDSSGPAFYGQHRLGTGNKKFRCWKFRTMRLDAEKAIEEYLQNNPDLRIEWEKYHKLREDPRVTRIGRFLRKTSLDELPQIWNVLRGEMSLVGPRPYLPGESEKIGAAQNEILRVGPGITGLWQVSGRSQTSFTDRVLMDAYYVRNWSVWLDLVILARTVTSVLFGRGAH